MSENFPSTYFVILFPSNAQIKIKSSSFTSLSREWRINTGQSHTLYYAKTCNECAGPISASLRRRCNTALKYETSQRWWTVGNTVSVLNGPRFKPQTSSSRGERVVPFYHFFVAWEVLESFNGDTKLMFGASEWWRHPRFGVCSWKLIVLLLLKLL